MSEVFTSLNTGTGPVRASFTGLSAGAGGAGGSGVRCHFAHAAASPAAGPPVGDALGDGPADRDGAAVAGEPLAGTSAAEAAPLSPPLVHPVAAASRASAPATYTVVLLRACLFTAPCSPLPFSDLDR
nr:hypothetical protein KPHV_35720 [Kitasatospora purpeofusca]